MATPTEAEVQLNFGKAIKLLEETRKFGEVNAQNWVGMEDAFIQSLESDFAAAMTAAVASGRSSLQGVLAAAESILAPHLDSYARHILNVPFANRAFVLNKLYERFVSMALSVQSRQITFATPVAGGGNSGNGILNRLTKDENNFDIENVNVEAKRAECIQDRSNGRPKHEELFRIEGAAPGIDELQVSGSGLVDENLRGVSARDSMVNNPSFDFFGGTAAVPTSITDWTVSVIANVQVDQVNFYRDFAGATQPGALRMLTNVLVTQKLSVKNAAINPTIPTYCQIAFNRQVYAGDGTLTLRLGNSSVAVVLAAQAGWNILRIPLTSASWFKNWNKQDVDIQVELSGNTVGDVLVDDLIFVPFFSFDASWWSMVGGSTPFLRRDVFTMTDTEIGAIIQRWLFRAFSAYLPHVPAAPTWAEP